MLQLLGLLVVSWLVGHRDQQDYSAEIDVVFHSDTLFQMEVMAMTVMHSLLCFCLFDLAKSLCSRIVYVHSVLF